MADVALLRFAYTPLGTFGALRVPAVDFYCYTVERPWLGNERNVSCIPTGHYTLRLGTFHHGDSDPSNDYPAYEVMDVPNRSLIKIHKANTMYQVKGCIAPGEHLGWINDTWAVSSSGVAFDRFMAAMGGVEEAGFLVADQVPFDWRNWPEGT